ncbi:cell wall-binding repeat-containing protein [Metaclostridioides mangenotii]|uniref:Cell wall-binding protein n=1 Tax=Metaclostridioides mangenotii TaxID=1540 RepID=A0ABS4EBH3_9FIRM|nr:cell wall-binding repeat-containing protein [Clostridioides mangenotii]MBP1855287.1 putative cell wall-binding protein [Clostridioides mangenotii]
MSKKRNLAVLMAAATVATSVAPVFADTAKSLDGETISAKDSAKMSDLKNEVEGYLDTRYVNDEDELNTPGLAGKSVYTVTADVTDISNQSALTGLDIKDDENAKKIATIAKIRDFEKVVNALDTDADTFTLSVVDKIGHTKVDDKIVDYTVEKYDTAEMTELKTKIDAIKALHFDAKGDLKQNKEDGVVSKALFKTVDTGVESGKDYILLTLNNSGNKTIKIKKDELKTLVTDGADLKVDIDFKEDSNKNKLDANGKIVTNPDDFVIEGLKYSKSNIDDDDKEDPKEFTIVNKDVAENVNANTLYNKDLKMLTKEGNEIAKFIKEYHESTKPGGDVGGTLTTSELRLNVPTEKSDVKSLFTNLTIKGTSSELKALAKVFKANGASIVDDLSAVEGLDINTLAGLDREATAIEISKQNRKDTPAIKNVVLVSGYAIADGLSATPFAKANSASILFAGKDSISEDTMDEIQALGGKVFIVGGTSSVSKDVEKQLDNKFISFERISGSDRMETSLKVAKKMTAVDGVFVAGGRAEADAMSVSGIAANENSPILLTDENGLTADQESWLKRQENVSDAYIAGGNNSVPTSVETQLRKITSKVKRLAGDDRQGTNAKVLNEFYKTSAFTKVYVAKSDNNGLVDALPAGAIAGANPVVLATDALNSEQISALKSLDKKVGTLDYEKYQIGYGIADKVWDAINDID